MSKYLILIFIIYCVRYSRGNYEDYPKRNDTEKRKLIYLQLVSTNGHYAPLDLYPTDKNSEEDWPEGLGALTKLGKLQQYELGKFLRQIYKNFISSIPDEIDAFSSAEDRSTYSLLTLLASLNAPTKDREFIPGFPWQPPTLCFMDDDDVFFRYNETCLNPFLDANQRFQEYHGERDKSLYAFWEEHSGLEILDWNEVAKMYDTIEKEMKAGLSVPWWAEKHLEDMERITNAAYSGNFNSTLTLKIKVGFLLDFLLVRMRVKMFEDDPSPKIRTSVYMTHDWNMAALLRSIDHFSGVRPPPCTTLAVELYSEPGDTDHSVRLVLFNSTSPELGRQPAHVLTLLGCDSEFCPLKKFVDFFDYLLPIGYSANCGYKLVWVDSVESQEKGELTTLYENLKNITKDGTEK